jgi:PAS domain S-box-containing protein
MGGKNDAARGDSRTTGPRERRADTDRGDAAARIRLLESVVTHATDAVVLTEASPIDEPGPVITYVNDAFVEMTGYTAEEAVGRSPRFLQGPDTEPRAIGRIREALEGGGAVRQELLNYRKDGTTFWVELDIVPIPDQEGRVTHFAAIQREITARRRTDEALKASEERFRRAIRFAPLPLMIHAEDGDVVQVNDAWVQLTGYGPEDLPTVEEWTGKAYGERGPEVRASIERLYRLEGPVDEGEFEITNRSGDRRIWNFRSAPLGPGPDGRQLVMSMAVDVTERRVAEEALRQSETRFRTALANAPIGMALVGLDGRFLSVNLALERILGYDEEALLGLTFQELTHPGDLDADLAQARRLEAGEITSYDLEKRYIHKDGRIVWALLSGSLVRGADGKPLYFIAQVQDVTEQKKVEAARRRLTAILEATPDFVGIADAEGRAEYLNHAGRTLVGIGPDEDVSGMSIAHFHTPWAASLILREGIPSAIRDGAWTGETALRSREGGEVPVSQVILAHPSPSGRVEYLSTIIRDISDRKRAEEDQRYLSEASRILGGSLDPRALLARLTELVVPRQADYCVIDMARRDGSIERVAARHAEPGRMPLLERLRRFPPPKEGVVGFPVVLREGEAELVPEVSDAWIRAVAVDEEHARLLRELAPSSVILVPLRTQERVIGVMTISRTHPRARFGPADVTTAEDLAARAALALENARLYREVQQAVRMRDEVMRIVAHDLRDPLGTIALSTRLLLETPASDVPTRSRQLEAIQRSVGLANRLIRDLLDVARMEAGRLTIAPEAVDPGALARDSVEAMRPLAEESGVNLEIDVPRGLPEVRADADRVRQVFWNLVGNAIKFTPEGGSIRVRVEGLPRAVRFSVVDSGPGIAPEQVPHLFETFWQARKGEGAGLGLPIARGIVEAHGGRMGVETRVGEGSTFHFTLPLVPAGEGRS